MAQYNIYGQTVNVDDSIQGQALTDTLTQTSQAIGQANLAKYQSLIGQAEGADYNTIVGGQKITDFSAHPNVVGMRTADGPSTAAGRYQITAGTWNGIAPALGIHDFSPASQDAVSAELIRRKGAMDDVMHGDFNAANQKLGGTWQALPTGASANQGKRSQGWWDSMVNGTSMPLGPGAPGYVAAPMPGPSATTYQEWAPQVPDNTSEADLAKNPGWIAGSRQQYNSDFRSTFQGTDEDAANYGLRSMSAFNNNSAAMAAKAASLIAHGTQDDKNAFVWMMQAYDNKAMSLDGVGRGLAAAGTDPLTYVGLGTFGVGSVAKIAATREAKHLLVQRLVESLGRTGIQAGTIGGMQGAMSDTIGQNVKIDAGAQKDFSYGQLAGQTAAGAVGGTVLGTTADALLTKAIPAVKDAVGAISDFLRPGAKAAAKDIHPGVPLPNTAAGPHDVPVANPMAPSSALADANKLVQTATGNMERPALTGTHAADAEGAPLVMHHGSEVPFTAEDFKGGHFTSNRELAQNYAGMDGSSGNILSAHLDIQNPMPWADAFGKTPEEIKTAGFDGTVMKDDSGLVHRAVVTDPSQIHPISEHAAVPTPEDAPVADRSQPHAPADTLPQATSFTPQEVEAGMAEAKQKGRLWSDIPFVGPLDDRIATALVIPEQVGGMRDTSRSMSQLAEDGEKVAAQLRNLSDSSFNQTAEVLRNGTTYTANELPVVSKAMSILSDEANIAKAELIQKINAEPNSPDLQKWLAKKDAISVRQEDAEKAKTALGSFAGSLTRQRVDDLTHVQGLSIDRIMEALKADRPTAENLWAETVMASQASSKAKQVAGEYDMRIKAALDAGDRPGALKLQEQKRMELNGIGNEAGPHGSTLLGTIHSFFSGLRELVISNVFSAKTVMINLIPAAFKTAILPAAKFMVVNPLDRAAQAELGAHYAAMGSTIRGALAAANYAFKYEASFLTRGSGRLMEGEMTLKGRIGGAIRFFPRVLNASDEFLSHINYAGFVAGKAANKAMLDAQAQGLTGMAAKSFVKDAVKAARDGMYSEDTASMVQPVVNKGVNLGLSGDDLHNYVNKAISKSTDPLRSGTDQAAIDDVRDVLFKRPFTGGNSSDGWVKGEMSGAAQKIEEGLRKAPEFSLLIGQLFFRTPIRVFEEGLRLTPGVQILAPGFMRDLAGLNGPGRQVRANAEALTSLAITASVLSLYAAGRITGSGVYMNAQQSKNRADAPEQEPYTIRLHDGTTWSYKNYDPIAIPIKIMLNAFEGMDELKIKEAQEQYVNRLPYQRLEAQIAVATMAVAAAITDANLVAGLKGTINLGLELADPEHDDAAIIRKFKQEVAMLVPNTIHKIMKTNDPGMRDPATYMQAISSGGFDNSMAVGGMKSSFAYDPLGQVRTPSSLGQTWNIFATTTAESRGRGLSEEHGAVMNELDRLAQVAGATFRPMPVKQTITGPLDWRTQMTADGKENLFDRANRHYRELNPDKVLAPICAAPLPDGTYKYTGEKVAVIQKTMAKLQQAAVYQTLNEEKVQGAMMTDKVNTARGLGGLMDFDNRSK